MKIRILRPALEDLDEGRRFYELQQERVGDYFLDSLFTEIDSLMLHVGIHSVHFGYHRLLPVRDLLPGCPGGGPRVPRSRLP